jgi:glycosyltransferase involved in cell wall biosynthesis
MSRPRLARATLWNRAAYRDLRDLIRRERPHVAHFHNTFPLISPAAYHAARAEGLPVVQTLHNYRLLCPNALFYRDNRVCEDCMGKLIPWPGVLHACYRESRASSGVVAAMLAAHRAIGTWTSVVDLYIALTEFARQKFIQGGLPAGKIVTKPNFIYPDPGPGEGRGKYLLFVGRLSREKGVDTMLSAWESLKGQAYLKILGDGPLAPAVARATERDGRVEWLGRQPRDRVLALMKDAQALLFPSVWYEGFPAVIVESYAVGLPVIASDLGSMSSLIEHGRTGYHFRHGDPRALAEQVERTITHPQEIEGMRAGARAEYEAGYTAERNYRMLIEIYQTATRTARAKSPGK